MNKFYHNSNDTNWVFVLLVIIVIAIVWLIGSFIAMDLEWPIRTVIGRIIAVCFLVLIIKAAIES